MKKLSIKKIHPDEKRRILEKTGRDQLVLSDYFDLIGGTSTGALIATALALGWTAEQAKALYFDMGASVFRKPTFSIPFVNPVFSRKVLRQKLREVMGDRTLGSADLQTGLAIVAKRIDTASPWVLTNNPAEKFWISNGDNINNRDYSLADLLRASTAAPYYFNPQSLRISKKEKGMFVDGRLTPHNNASMQLLMLASLKGHGLHWPLSDDKLMIISIGSGWKSKKISYLKSLLYPSSYLAVKSLESLMWDNQVQTVKMLQWLSEPKLPWLIDSEVEELKDEVIHQQFNTQALLTFQHYNVPLEEDMLSKMHDIRVKQKYLDKINDFMNPEVMKKAYKLAKSVAEKQVQEEHFPDSFNQLSI